MMEIVTGCAKWGQVRYGVFNASYIGITGGQGCRGFVALTLRARFNLKKAVELQLEGLSHTLERC